MDEHRVMLADAVRTSAYQRAIAEVVTPGMRVLDFGCGTGILSHFAERAGAAEVIAVDRSPFIRKAREIAAKNGLRRTRFFHGEADDLSVDDVGKVDVIVSEWMGHFVFAERMLGPLLGLRDRLLAKGGVMLPRRIELFAGLVTDGSIVEEQAFFRARRYGVDFSPIADWPFRQVVPRRLPRGSISPDVVPLGSLAMATHRGESPMLTGTTAVTVGCTVHALVGWFEAELAPGIRFGTGPFSPATHWAQLVFPLREPLAIAAGDAVTVTIDLLPTPKNARVAFRWSLRGPSGARSEDDLVERVVLGSPLPRGFL